MSREILFRGRCLHNGKWVEGGYCQKYETTYCLETDAQNPLHHYIACDEMTDWNLPNKIMLYEVDPSTVCQYTDRNDCKGRKIYEGDIIDNYNHTHNRHMRGIIKFGEYSMPTDAYCMRKGAHLGFYIYWMDEYIRDTYRCDFAWYANVLEVIGNIWDTPELLEGGTGKRKSEN